MPYRNQHGTYILVIFSKMPRVGQCLICQQVFMKSTYQMIEHNRLCVKRNIKARTSTQETLATDNSETPPNRTGLSMCERADGMGH